MLQFLQPIWLWASAAIIIPIVIHLWNVKQGKTLKVGNIFLFAESAKSGAKKRKLSELLLLLLRCLLLIVLAVLMAKSAWLQLINTKEKGWLLIPKNELHEAYQAYQPMIDSLTKNGFVLHNFDESFKPENLKEALSAKQDSSHPSNLSYWTLVKQADENSLPDLPVYVFTDNKLKHFTGLRPTVSAQIKWYTFPGSDTASSWLEKAYQVSADSIRFVTGNSVASGTRYSHQNLSIHDRSELYKTIINHPYSATLNNDETQQEKGIDTSSRTIVIYTKTFTSDAAYVEAAVKALQSFTQYKINVYRCAATKDIPGNYDWLFWLSDDTIPPSLLTKNVLLYAPGVPDQQPSGFFIYDDASLTTAENLLVYQRVVNKDSSCQIIWQDGFGNPLLSLEKRTHSVYHFYSHFNPQWNDLVWSSRFPQALYELLFSKQNNDEMHDKRMMDSSQIQPIYIAGKAAIKGKKDTDLEDVANWFWLAAFVLLVTERVLSFHTKNIRA